MDKDCCEVVLDVGADSSHVDSGLERKTLVCIALDNGASERWTVDRLDMDSFNFI